MNIEKLIPSCCGEVIENSAGGNTFWYCKGCKKEVSEARTTPASIEYPNGKIYDYETGKFTIMERLKATPVLMSDIPPLLSYPSFLPSLKRQQQDKRKKILSTCPYKTFKLIMRTFYPKSTDDGFVRFQYKLFVAAQL